ncbi:unnamed protein product [Prorocentrum cordatum]|uniref:Uncharacterized protein n=1 Tax=Prorocentrum cordatum TaxID=2364126 RepID=A0ABN9RLC4_9DINO|nr:unnamed protein product [Polarella glacialis]
MCFWGRPSVGEGPPQRGGRERGEKRSKAKGKGGRRQQRWQDKNSFSRTRSGSDLQPRERAPIPLATHCRCIPPLLRRVAPCAAVLTNFLPTGWGLRSWGSAASFRSHPKRMRLCSLSFGGSRGRSAHIPHPPASGVLADALHTSPKTNLLSQKGRIATLFRHMDYPSRRMRGVRPDPTPPPSASLKSPSTSTREHVLALTAARTRRNASQEAVNTFSPSGENAADARIGHRRCPPACTGTGQTLRARSSACNHTRRSAPSFRLTRTRRTPRFRRGPPACAGTGRSPRARSAPRGLQRRSAHAALGPPPAQASCCRAAAPPRGALASGCPARHPAWASPRAPDIPLLQSFRCVGPGAPDRFPGAGFSPRVAS